MKKALKILLIGIVAIVGIFLIIGVFAPKKYHVERSIVINAPSSAVMEQVKSLKNMNAWSPWTDYDPNMKITYAGVDGTVGSAYEWEGNKEVGKGKQEVISITDNKVETKVSFIEPFESTSLASVQVEPQGKETKVTWGLDGEHSYPMNAMCVFMSMDAMIGKEYEKGLDRLKTRVESMPATEKSSASFGIQEIELEPKEYIGKKAEVGFNDISNYYASNLPKLFEAAGKAGIQPTGAPTGLYWKWDEQNKKALMAVALPVAANDKKQVKDYERLTTPGGKALLINYYGSYEKSIDAHYAMDGYMKQKGFQLNDVVIEEYMTDPSKEQDTSKWLTKIIYPVKSKESL